MWRRSILHVGWGGAVLAFWMLPGLAQPANFGTIDLVPGFGSTQAEGFTQGSFSLSSIANRDRAGNLCVGFADSTPDHILVLQRSLPSLRLQVSSEGDTTLLVRGPRNSIRCGDDISRTDANAAVQDTDWQAGEYRVWVGSFDADTRINYRLNVQE